MSNDETGTDTVVAESLPYLDKAALKKLLMMRAYGMSDGRIAEEFGWTVAELQAHAEGLRRRALP